MSLHLDILRRMPDHLLNDYTTRSCAIRAGMVHAMRVASFAYHLFDKERLFIVSLYPLCVDFIQRMRGSTMRSKMRGERPPSCKIW